MLGGVLKFVIHKNLLFANSESGFKSQQPCYFIHPHVPWLGDEDSKSLWVGSIPTGCAI